MKRALALIIAAGVTGTVWLLAQPIENSIADGFRLVEVASAADAMEQLYGQRAYMSHEIRPLAPAKFAGPAVTVLLKREEHTEGASASQGMLDLIDSSPAGSIYVMVLDRGAANPGSSDRGTGAPGSSDRAGGAPGWSNDGADYAGIGGLMATAMK